MLEMCLGRCFFCWLLQSLFVSSRCSPTCAAQRATATLALRAALLWQQRQRRRLRRACGGFGSCWWGFGSCCYAALPQAHQEQQRSRLASSRSLEAGTAMSVATSACPIDDCEVNVMTPLFSACRRTHPKLYACKLHAGLNDLSTSNTPPTANAAAAHRSS